MNATNTGQSLDKAVAALEHMMQQLLNVHHQLLDCIQQKRQAIATARVQAVGDLTAREQQLMQQIAICERQRSEVAGRIMQQIAPQERRAVRVSDLAEHLQEPQRSLLLHQAGELRSIILRIRHETQIVHRAAEALSLHMAGIAQCVYSALSRARIYGQAGRVLTGSSIPSALDIKS